MTFHKCNCMYIPPFVLGHVAKRGDEEQRQQRAQATDRQAKLSRTRRVQRPVEQTGVLSRARQSLRRAQARLSPVSTMPPNATSSRLVYDCQHQWVQRVDLVRGEGDPATGDDDVDAVYDSAESVLGFFAELDRRSIDNFEMNLILNVHFGTNYMNAFWDGDEMTFGDGDGSHFYQLRPIA